jgi:hypothetical protein
MALEKQAGDLSIDISVIDVKITKALVIFLCYLESFFVKNKTFTAIKQE